MTRGGETYYYQTNAHGDVVSLTDSTGAVVNTYSYDPWGVLLSANETVTNPLRYCGYYYDSSTGLYYPWHRYYDPQLRRFLTPDLVFGSIYDPACLNWYMYAFDNPTAFADPSGLMPGWVSWVLFPGTKAIQLLTRPLEDMAQDSLEWYVGKAETASDPLKPLYWLLGGLSGLMTPENAWATEIILSLGASWGLSGRAGVEAKVGVLSRNQQHFIQSRLQALGRDWA